MSEMNNLPKLIKPNELKNYFGIGKDKLYELLKDRTFPSVRIGRYYYVIEDEFIEWLSKQTKKSK